MEIRGTVFWDTILLEEDTKHLLLKCSETKKWREEFVLSKQLNRNEDTNCRHVIKVKNIQKYLFKIRCKCENKARGAQTSLEVTRE
jgi:hypothetical protein